MAQKDRFTNAKKSRLAARTRQWALLLLSIILGVLISSTAQSQHIYHKQKARHYKAKFRTQIHDYTNACNILERKKYQKPKSNFRLASNRKPVSRPMAEVDPNVPVQRISAVKPKPETQSVVPIVTAKVEETPSTEKLEKLHNKEDKVLKENHLPAPTSKQHEIIRELVAQNLKNKKDNEPIELAPLYFNYNEDEFSVVDMNPFLIAVEYALQGRTILIEGHTDSDGHNGYNVKLSIKRVQKIRQLMHDMGVPDDRISVMGYGEEVAQHDNTTQQGKQMNRRVDFKAF
jgi:outer membrane protein OmpA-like peptidoglycan-associated protein